MPRDNHDTSPHLDLPELSNEDVAILYEIINVSSQSQQIQSLPFRAIFAAYDEVLAKHGISPAHDQLYLRFLFRLGERLGQNEAGEYKDLFTEFEALLLELGIKIELESGQGSVAGTEDAYDEDAEIQTETQEFTDSINEPSTPHRRARRFSFSEVLDIEAAVNKADRDYPESPASISRLQNTSDGFGSTPYTKRKLRQPALERTLSDQDLKTARKRRGNVLTGASRKQTIDNVHEMGEAHTSRSRQRQTRDRNHQQAVPEFEIYEDAPVEEYLPAKPVTNNTAAAKSRQASARPHVEQMQTDARILDAFRVQRLSRFMFKKWHDILLQKQRQRSQMNVLAIQYDRRELVKQAWNEWLEKYREKEEANEVQRQKAKDAQLAAEQDRYLVLREISAAKARDSYLVSKAFSHWASCATERVQENALARRHLIRLRYFTAWKEATVVNEIKVRRTIFKKFLTVWKQKLHNNIVLRQEASVIHEHSLVQSAYWNWFWRFCELRAPEWHNVKLKQRHLGVWASAYRRHVEHEDQIVRKNLEHVQRRAYVLWNQKARHIKLLAEQADQFQRRKLLAVAISNWKIASQLANPACRISAMVDKRVVSSTFAMLCGRSNLCQQAKHVDGRRLTRNTWTTWNDELRVQTMQHQIDDRLVLQALYKWVLAERGALMKHVHNERLQQQHLNKMLKGIENKKAQHAELEQQVRRIRDMALVRAALKVWSDRHKQCQQQQELAQSFHTPLMTAPLMRQWHIAHELQAQLARWAVEAAFYFRGKRSIKKWQTTLKENQKQRRREAYTAVKKTYNKNLARSVLQQWNQQTHRLQELQIREHDLQVQRAEGLLSTIIYHWSERLQHNMSLLSQASDYDSEKLTSTIFRSWNNRSRMAITNSTTASSFYDTRIQKAAYDSVRQLQLKILTLQTHNAKANSVLSWNLRRRTRGLLRAWADRAASRRSPRESHSLQQQQASPSADSGPLLPHGMPLLSLARTPRAIRRGQPLSDQPVLPEILPQTPFPTFTTPAPPHLSTPANRAARMKAFTQTPLPQSSQTHPPSREQSHTPPTTSEATATIGTPRSRAQVRAQGPRTLRFAQEDIVLDSPLRIPAPTPVPPQSPGAEVLDASIPATDIQPRRRQYIARTSTRPSALGSSITGLGAGSGVRRSLFPRVQRSGRDASQIGDGNGDGDSVVGS